MERLRKRSEFLAVAKGRRTERAGFVIQGRRRSSPDAGGESGGAARVGLTVTRKIGNAVVRNRVRRRLREAVRQLGPEVGAPGTDYVVVARERALTLPFGQLADDLRVGIVEINRILAKVRAKGERAATGAAEANGQV